MGSTGRTSCLWVVAVIALLTAGWTVVTAADAASARPKNVNHCIAPDGTDLNELFGVSEQIVTGTSPSCTEVGSGEHFRPSVMPWFMNRSFEVAPAGFVPAGPTPLEDFVAKFEAVKYVVDPGTKFERTVVFSDTAALFTGTFAGFPLANPLTLGVVHPLRVGHHVIETFWDFTAMHCDGFGDDTGPGGNCFHAGETQLPTMEFDVVSGHF